MKRVLMFAAAALCATALHTQVYAQAKVGEAAPEFTLKDAEGKDRSLSEFKGKYVVLEWHNLDCPFVKKFYKNGDMQKMQKEQIGKGDVVWLTMNSSAEGQQGHFTAEQAQKHVAKVEAAPSAYLLDPDGEVGKKYGASTTPHMYVINPEGKLIYAGAIDDNNSNKPEDIAGANNYVLAALTQARAGEEVKETVTKPYGCSVKYKN